ncbi:MAG TPA: nucleotidyltransferase domain-containing protein [Gemmatimonadales bacterium]
MIVTPRGPLPIDHHALGAACERLDVRMLVLFGSHATGSPAPGPESDVDIALAFDRAGSRPGWWECHESLSPAFGGAPLDVVFLADADPLFRWEIMRAGRLLWGDPIEHLEFRAFAYRDYTDSEDLRMLERQLFERKMALVRQRLHAPS